MNSQIKELSQNLVHLSTLINQPLESVTCLECCEFYKNPRTATCGHTLCQFCWRGRRTCPHCTQTIEQRLLKHNEPMQSLTEKMKTMKEHFEKLFNINLTEFLLEASENDPTKNVKDWLASSQNHFSAPLRSSDPSSQEQQIGNALEISSSNILIHKNTKKVISPEKVVYKSIPQDDWDKIEVMPDTTTQVKDKENVIGPMDIEPFNFDDDHYTINNPRRSSRKRDLATDDKYKNNEQIKAEKHGSKDNSGDSDKKSNIAKKNWNSVKKMRKEFSKLNKKTKSKLNISIEMCKKTQSTAKQNDKLPLAPSVAYDIDENTPDNFNIDKQKVETNQNNVAEKILLKDSLEKSDSIHSTNKHDEKYVTEETKGSEKQVSVSPHTNVVDDQMNSVEMKKIGVTQLVKMPFYKKGALYQTDKEHNNDIDTKTVNTVNHNVDTNTASNDDIEITIKVGNTITNICIKKKSCVDLKVKTDREIQTSLDPNVIHNENIPQQIKTQNVIINVNDNSHTIAVNSSQKTSRVTDQNIKEPDIMTSQKCSSKKTKKNTDTADTSTRQFEITESEEKELSKVMDHVESDERNNSKSETVTDKKHSQKDQPNSLNNQEDLDYLNELDIFGSESVKELNVEVLKEHAPSEIFVSTVHSKKRTQKLTEKRDREDQNGDDSLPNSKKAKIGIDKPVMDVDETIEPDRTNPNPTDSEPMNYDSIMGKVFASIDAEIEENRQSQIDKNSYTKSQRNKAGLSQTKHDECNKKTQTKGIECSINLNDYNQKDSENLFSVCVDKDDLNNIEDVPANDKVHPEIPTDNMEQFLTPVTHHNQGNTDEAMIIDDDDIHDDSDKSVVEETPQKTSFIKPKQKSAINETQSQKESVGKKMHEKKRAASNEQTVINISDSTNDITTNKEVTVVETAAKLSLETPLNINKFTDNIKYKSTPMARKSLNFESGADDDPEQTLCNTNEIAKTTQEKEIMSKAFEKSISSPSTSKPPVKKNLEKKRFCVAGSCLVASELTKLKHLCAKNEWTYSDRYTKELTHLVVGVDEENRAQRSVKYMCALASSIWIVSFAWVEKCLQTREVVNEHHYEALDSSGDPGPRRSRLATKKLFQGITFHCMEPFSVLNSDSLKEMLEACGGRVVEHVTEARVTDATRPVLLLAEPEHTQEDKYMEFAVQFSVVPVNYEWALNCIGSYTLSTIQGLLLCPPPLLPQATRQWPRELMQDDDD